MFPTIVSEIPAIVSGNPVTVFEIPEIVFVSQYYS
jgi:hypothetical protein